jgi:GTPase SAR1 family protein
MSDQTMELAELDARVEELQVRVAVAATEFGRADLAEALTSGDHGGSGGAPSAIRVYVVGEKKRGKSSLINAMLGDERLLPVDVDIATSCYIAVSNGEERTATVFTEDEPDGVLIRIDELAEWASVEGNRDPNDPDRVLHEGVLGVEVTVDAPTLGELVLVDTPGVGGLEAGHTDLTLAALAGADALVFVVDPGSPLSSHELAFLERASHRIASVVFVLTKIDSFPGWREILESNQGLIARYAPRFAKATWMPTSAALAGDAANARSSGDLESADALDRQSGIRDLTAYLRHEFSNGARLRVVNRIHETAGVITELAVAEQQRLRAARSDPALVDELDQRSEALGALLTDAARWPNDLRLGFDKLGSDLQRSLRHRMSDLRRDLEERVAVWKAPDTDAFVADLAARLRAQWVELDSQRRTGAVALAAELARQLADTGFDEFAAEQPYPERLHALPPAVERPTDDGSIIDALPAMAQGMIGVTLLHAIVPGLVLGPFGFLAVAAGCGFAIKGKRERDQHLREARVDATRYLNNAIGEAIPEMTEAVRLALAGDHTALHTQVSERLAARRAQLEQQIVEARAVLDASEDEQTRVRSVAEAHIARLRELAMAGVELSKLIDQHASAGDRAGTAVS